MSEGKENNEKESERDYNGMNITDIDKKKIMLDFGEQLEGFTLRIKRNISDNLEEKK